MLIGAHPKSGVHCTFFFFTEVRRSRMFLQMVVVVWMWKIFCGFSEMW